MEDYLFRQECYSIIGCAMEVHKELGCGFLEAIYQEALEISFHDRNIPYEREKQLDVFFRNQLLKKKYLADFICYDEIIIELKANECIIPKDIAQVLNYLKASNKKLGLLINFGALGLQYKRIIR